MTTWEQKFVRLVRVLVKLKYLSPAEIELLDDQLKLGIREALVAAEKASVVIPPQGVVEA